MMSMSTVNIEIAQNGYAGRNINWPMLFRPATAIPNQRAQLAPLTTANGRTAA